MTFEGLTIFTLACIPLHRQTIQATAWNLKLPKLNTCTAFYFQIDKKLRASPARRHRKDHNNKNLFQKTFGKVFCRSVIKMLDSWESSNFRRSQKTL